MIPTEPGEPGLSSGPPAAPGGYPAPRLLPPKKRRRGLIIGIVVAVVIVLGAAGTGAYLLLSRMHHTPAGPAALGDGKALLAEIRPMPAGAQQISIMGASDGIEPVHLYVSAHFGGDGSEEADLRTMGFRVAAERIYKRTDGEFVDTQLVQFATSNGAASYLRQQVGAYLADPDVTDKVPVTQVVGGASFEFGTIDPLYHSRRAVLMGRVGAVVVVMDFYTKDIIYRDANVFTFLDQVKALPAGS